MLRVTQVVDTIQGEGLHTGRPVRLIRLAGCTVGCPFCDTKDSQDPLSGELVPEEQLLSLALPLLITGGEPCLQNFSRLLSLSETPCWLETSGSYPLQGDLIPEHITICPKAPGIHSSWERLWGRVCLKVLVQTEADILSVSQYPKNPGCGVYLQPEFSARERVFPACVAACLENNWGLSVQLHKLVGVA